MANLNKFICIGRMIKDCESNYTNSGVCVTKFTLATNEKFKEDEKTEFTNFVAFGKAGETIARYCSKGSELYVEARKETQRYQDSNGQDKWSTSFIVREFQFLSTRQAGQQPRQTAQQQEYPSQRYQQNEPSQQQQYFDGQGGQVVQQDDDIPF